jgi:hypothetical protein
MENAIHKGTELNNVKETWDENERNLRNQNSLGSEGNIADDIAPANDLDKLVKNEARDYDNTENEKRLLTGERATINDDADEGTSSG